MAPPRRIPTKAELLRLQRQFKTDARIAERLGNVTPYLVSYWRRKRSVPNYSAPKFSEKDISILWERFGDDDRCGAELGVSKAAFYSWRRRYGIKSKPAFLKLEQMEIQFPGDGSKRSVSSNQGSRPATHKLVQAKSATNRSASRAVSTKRLSADRVSTNEASTVTPDLVVIDNPSASAISTYIAQDGKPNLPVERMAILLNGDSGAHPPSGVLNGSVQDGAVFEWVKKRQIRHAFNKVDGNMWDALYTSGNVLPGQLVVCQRGYERFAGAIGALGWWLADIDLVTLFEAGRIETPTPKVFRVNITGKRLAPISATDITLNLAANLADSLSEKNYLNAAIEYAGSALGSMPIVDRQTLCSIGSLIDLRSALTPCDTLTLRHISALGNWKFEQISPDRDAEFVDSYQLNIESVKPMVAIKHAQSGAARITQQSQLSLDSTESENNSATIDVATSGFPTNGTSTENGLSAKRAVSFHAAQEVEGLAIDVVFLGGSPGGHYESLRKAAEALHGKRVAEQVRLLVSPISQSVYLRCLKRGILRQLLESGAVILNPGVDSQSLSAFGISPIAKVVTASVEPLFSTNECSTDRYVVSPLTAAVSAASGHLLDPRGN